MDAIKAKFKANGSLYIIYISTFLISLHYYLVAYVNSSLLEQYTTKETVGALFTLGAILNIIIFLYISKILRRTGNYRLMLTLIMIELGAILGIAFSSSPYIIFPLFIIHHAVIPTISFNLDIFLESETRNEVTGTVRGFFNTLSNIALVVAPLIIALIINGGNFFNVYLLSTLFLLPLFFIVFTNLKRFTDSDYKSLDFTSTAKAFFSNRNVYNVFMAHFVLQLFYAWMTIFMPIYLHDTVGMSYKTIFGIVFSIMFLPFVFFEYPLGKLADRKLGEKEIILSGFVLTAFFTLALSFITSKSVALWTTLLFMTRLGASLVEVGSETYFFKQMTTRDSTMISFFRMTRPLSYISAPIAASVLSILLVNVLHIEYRYTFLILGIFVLWGIHYTARIVDTR